MEWIIGAALIAWTVSAWFHWWGGRIAELRDLAQGDKPRYLEYWKLVLLRGWHDTWHPGASR